MAEAKDTVIKMKWMNKEVQEDQDRLLLQQAEITWKARQPEIDEAYSLGYKEAQNNLHSPQVHAIAKETLDKAFKAGQEEKDKEWKEWQDKYIPRLIYDTRKEVVEWVEEHKPWLAINIHGKWRAQKKEWGVK